MLSFSGGAAANTLRVPGTADFEIGGCDQMYQLSFRRPTTRELGIVAMVHCDSLPSSGASSLPMQVELAAEALAKETPLQPLFTYTGFEATYNKQVLPGGVEIKASLTIPHPKQLNKRLGSLVVTPEHKPPVFKLDRRPGRFSPVTFVDTLVDDKDPADFLLSPDNPNSRTDSIEIHDAAAHVALGQMLLEQKTIKILRERGKIEKARGTQNGFLDILDNRLNLYLGQNIVGAFRQEQISDEQLADESWREVGYKLSMLEGTDLGREEALARGLQMREHCVILGEAATRAMEKRRTVLGRIIQPAFDWLGL